MGFLIQGNVWPGGFLFNSPLLFFFLIVFRIHNFWRAMVYPWFVFAGQIFLIPGFCLIGSFPTINGLEISKLIYQNFIIFPFFKSWGISFFDQGPQTKLVQNFPEEGTNIFPLKYPNGNHIFVVFLDCFFFFFFFSWKSQKRVYFPIWKVRR